MVIAYLYTSPNFYRRHKMRLSRNDVQIMFPNYTKSSTQLVFIMFKPLGIFFLIYLYKAKDVVYTDSELLRAFKIINYFSKFIHYVIFMSFFKAHCALQYFYDTRNEISRSTSVYFFMICMILTPSFQCIFVKYIS